MDKQNIINRIEYVVCCVGAFASRFKLSNAQAYAYLRRFQAIDFLIDCYEAEHTLSIEDAVEDMQAIKMLMEKYGWDMKHALDELYTSETFKRLCDPRCGLYYESPVYVFNYLENEMRTGQVG